jgi:putative transcriptional regulator
MVWAFWIRAAFGKITLYSAHLDGNDTSKVVTIAPNQIRAMCARATMSQMVFARYLNLTVGYGSQLEGGATLALLIVIKRKGIEAIRHSSRPAARCQSRRLGS